MQYNIVFGEALAEVSLRDLKKGQTFFLNGDNVNLWAKLSRNEAMCIVTQKPKMMFKTIKVKEREKVRPNGASIIALDAVQKSTTAKQEKPKKEKSAKPVKEAKPAKAPAKSPKAKDTKAKKKSTPAKKAKSPKVAKATKAPKTVPLYDGSSVKVYVPKADQPQATTQAQAVPPVSDITASVMDRAN